MARGEDVFCKIEPEFGLGLTPAGVRLRALSKIHRLAYYDLWMAAVKLRQDIFELDKSTEKTLLNFCDFSKKSQLFFFLSAAKEQKLIRTLAEKERKIFRFQVLYVRDKHRGYKFKDSPNGEQTLPEERVKSISSSSLGSSSPSLAEEEEGDFYPAERETTEPASQAASAPLAEPAPLAVSAPRAEPVPLSAPDRAEGEPERETPAVRMLEGLRLRWERVRSAFPQLEIHGLDLPEQLAELAVRLEGEGLKADPQLVTAHYLEALGGTGANNPWAAARTRSLEGHALRNGTLVKLRKALGEGTEERRLPAVLRADLVCRSCGKRFMRGLEPGERPPEECTACTLAASKEALAREGVMLP